MFKIESYITPMIMSYVDKYVKLKPEDFQLSLWGGDAVLNKLDLRLDVIERALHLPVTLAAGHIHELRLHVPWTKLGSESVTITINTVECVLKLYDTCSETEDTSSSKSVKTQQSAKKSRQGSSRKQNNVDLPPGYLQSVINRVLNNVHVVINNLILKYVDEDIVLSLNVKSGEVFSASSDWTRAFVDLTPEELVLRKMIELHDLTVCLDKRDSSGKIHVYQDPIVYRCSLLGRVHMTYDNINASIPSRVKFNVLCEKVDFSLTDTQLPMFLRLVELVMAIYYGTLETPGDSGGKLIDSAPSGEVEEKNSTTEAAPTDVVTPSEGQEGWASWAWSYVPQILPSDQETDPMATKRQRKEPPIIAIGFYIPKACVLFKLTESIHEAPYFGPQKVQFKPLMTLLANGICLELLVKGMAFFDAQVGITSLEVKGQGDCVCGVSKVNLSSKDSHFATCGSIGTNKPTDFMANCLFDMKSPENRGERTAYIFDAEQHREMYTENYALRRWGALYLDYFYLMQEQTELSDTSSKSSTDSESDSKMLPPEISSTKILIGPGEVNVTSSLVHRVQKMTFCGGNHDYEPYSKPKPEIVDETRPVPSGGQILAMETFVSTKNFHMTLINCTINVLSADHPYCDVSKNKGPVASKSRKGLSSKSQTLASSASDTCLQALQIHAERFDMQVTKPMYARKLVKMVSKMPAPSGNLLHHCHSHQNIKVFSLQAGLLCFDGAETSPTPLSLLQPCSAAYYVRTLLLPVYWTKFELIKSEATYELPSIVLNCTRSQLMLAQHIVDSWIRSTTVEIRDTTLLDDVFKPSSSAFPHGQPLLEASVNGVEIKAVSNDSLVSYTGILADMKVSLMTIVDGTDHVVPIVQGPMSTSDCVNKTAFDGSANSPRPLDEDLLNFTFQIPKVHNNPSVPAIAFLSVEGVGCLLDPALHDWLLYEPSVRHPKATYSIDHQVAHAALPVIPEAGSTKSASTVTQPSATQTRSQSVSKSQKPTVAETVSRQQSLSDKQVNKMANKKLSEKAADLYNMIRHLHVQVEVKSSVIVLPSKSLCHSSTSNLLTRVQSEYQKGDCPPMLVVNLPTVVVHSAGHKPMSPLQDIPVKMGETFSHIERLPWSLNIKNFSVYTLHSKSICHYLVTPLGVTSTVAITNKQDSHADFTALNLCIHTDMDAVQLRCSNEQISLVCEVLVELVNVLMSVRRILTKQQECERDSSGIPQLCEIKQEIKTPTLTEPDTAFETFQASREVSPIVDAKNETEVAKKTPELSLWIQWTFPKVTLKMYCWKSPNQEAMLCTELEDVTTFIDVHRVYAKVKSKVGMVSVMNYVKSAGCWVPGPWEGVTLCASDRISRRFQIVTNKLWSTNNTPIVNMFGMNEEAVYQHIKEHGFLSVTFTRALQRNVQTKYKHLGISSYDPLSSSLDENSKRYVHELCLNLQPCDIVLDVPTIMSSVDTFSRSLVKLGQMQKTREKSDAKSGLLKQAAEPRALRPLFKSNTLPLMYLNAKNFRLFLPCDRTKFVNDTGDTGKQSEDMDNDTSDTHNVFEDMDTSTVQTSAVDTAGEDTSTSHSTQDHDMVMLQCLQLSLTSQVDNPLPRLVLNKDLYSKAQQAGLTTQPGGVLEDRQYQLDFKALAVCTGMWAEMVQRPLLNSSSNGVQNPALEWNLRDMSKQDYGIAEMFPIVSSFDLCVNAAPALVYHPQNTSGPYQDIPICGYSLEVNATSDIDLYVSTNQVDLLCDLYSYHFPEVKTETSQSHGVPVNQGASCQPDALHKNDSGIESELSMKRTGNSCRNGGVDGLTPFDILLTARNLSLTTYSHKRKQSLDKTASTHADVETSSHKHVSLIRKKSDLDWKGETNLDDHRSDAASIDSHESFHHSSASSRSSRSYEASVSSQASTLDSIRQTPNKKLKEQLVVPAFFILFSQPYTVMHYSEENHSLELSCFNAALRGAKPGYVLNDYAHLDFADQCKLLPDSQDFHLILLESRPGEPHPKTGIPPALCTLTAEDFLTSPADICLKVERPMRVNLHLDTLDQIEHLISELSLAAKSTEDMEQKTHRSDMSSHPQRSPVTVSSRLQRLTVSTVEFTCGFGTVFSSLHAGLLLTWAGVKGEMELTDRGVKDFSKTATTYFNLRDISLMTTFDKTSHYLIGPLTVDLLTSFDWCAHSGPVWLPRTLVTMETQSVPIHFGHEHVMCLQLIMECLSKYLQSSKDQLPKSKVKSSSTERKSLESVSNFESSDDLRSGNFEYITGDDCPNLLPDPGEIVFCSETVRHTSAMTWCYPESRAVSMVTVMPVPFNMSTETLLQTQPKGILQYWDVLRKVFVDVAHFTFSEFEPVTLDLADLSAKQTIRSVSEIWRIAILSNVAVDASQKVSMPIVSPVSLAACTRVNSGFVPQLVPALQMSLSFGHVSLHMENHVQHLGKGTPDQLQPFILDQTTPSCQEYMTVTLDSVHLFTSLWTTPNVRVESELSMTASCQIVEYRYLLMQPLVDPFDVMVTLSADLTNMNIDTKTVFEPVDIHVGQNAVHTLNSAIQTWSQMSNRDADRVLVNYYVVCNDTQETLHISQVDTDENIVLQSREMTPYSWRTHTKKQLLHLCVDGMGWKWSDPFSLDNEGTTLRIIDSGQQRSALLISVCQISNVQKQITISGQLYVSSRLSQHLEVKLMTSGHERSSVLGSCQTVASYVVNPADIESLKVRLLGIKKPWSHEIAITGEKCKDHRLVKIPIGSKSAYIHIWCSVVTRELAGVQQILVLLTPLFVMRSYLPFPLFMNIITPRTQSTYQVTVEGFGVERELVGIPGDRDHTISFQTCVNSEESPPAMLTSGHISQVKCSQLTSDQSFEQLCYRWEKPADKCNEVFNNGFDVVGPHPEGLMDSHEGSIIPNMDITLDYRQMWPGCNTLLIETAPPYLMVNKTNLDITLCQEGLPNAIVKGKKYYVPSLPQGRFQLGLVVNSDLYCSPLIELSHDDPSHRTYLPRIQGLLYKTGHTHCAIYIKDQHKVCYLTVSSQVGPSSFRVLTISERFIFSLESCRRLFVQNCVLLQGKEKLTVSSSFTSLPLRLSSSQHKTKSSRPRVDPLPMWCLPPAQSASADLNTSWSEDCVHYVRFCLEVEPHAPSSARKRLFSEQSFTEKSASTPPAEESSPHAVSHGSSLSSDVRNSVDSRDQSDDCDFAWSHVVRVTTSDKPTRSCFSVPMMGVRHWRSVPFLLVCQEHEGITYLTIKEELTSSLCLHNNCPFSLNFGQTNITDYSVETSVHEEMELFNDLPLLRPHSSVHYTFPAVTAQFPTLSVTSAGVKLHLTLAGQSSRHPWSMGIDVTSERTQFVHIPAAVDVQVNIRTEGFCQHVHIEPASRAEVSAKEIRSRIGGKETSVLIESPRSTPERDDTTQHTASPGQEEVKKKAAEEPKLNLSVLVAFKSLCFILQDECSIPLEMFDVVRMTASDLVMAHRPHTPDVAMVMVSMSHLQVDNQLFSRENFDFPVVLLPQASLQPFNYQVDWDHIQQASSQGLLSVQCMLNSGSLESFAVNCRPLCLYFEDKFIYAVLKKIETLVPVPMSARKSACSQAHLPSRVVNTACILCHPVQLKSITFDQLTVLMSVHASLKLFIATDHAPLTFGRFHHDNVMTTTDQLLRAVTMHYVSGALYRAGWVVGSLEILGNPTSLVRNVSQGVGDLLWLPYSGLTQGPGAFMSGVSQGVGSLIRNISAGTLYSITNFASSVSRNMDRLSLDSDHLERQEESRRQKPERLSQGLRQGLTGFGISLLGAVAGLADQPIQNLTSSDLSSPVQRAAGVMTGVGKGLMGAVTKPIGGAAELVSQTGQGLLHGTGLGHLPSRLHPELAISIQDLRNSHLKLVWKMLPSLPNIRYLIAIPAHQVTPHSGQSVEVILLLTSQLLFVVSVSEDTQQQALSVSELECYSPRRTLLEIVKTLHRNQDSLAKDRVTQFVNESSSFHSAVDESASPPEAPFDTSVPSSGLYEFTVDSRSRELFLAFFKRAKNKLTAKGFND